MRPSIGIQSLAVSVPERVLAGPPRSASAALSPRIEEPASPAYRRARALYAGDPMGGARERRVLGSDESPLGLETAAVRRALRAAEIDAGDVDLLICSALLPASPGIGDAAFLAGELGLRGAAWNLEAEDASALTALQTASALVATGQHRRVLVVTSCTHSRASDAGDWRAGDAATAMVVGEVRPGTGLLGTSAAHCPESRAATGYELTLDGERWPRLVRRPRQDAERELRLASERYLKECSARALERAGVELEEIDCFVCSAPAAWYVSFCARLLGIDRRRTLSVYPLYADVGPALVGLDLFHAAHWRRLRPGDRVLACSVTGLASVSAAVLRWGDVALGPLPDGVSEARLRALEAEAIAGFALDRLESRAIAPARRTRNPRRRLERFLGEYVRLLLEEPPVRAILSPEQGSRFGTEAFEKRRRAVFDFLRDAVARATGAAHPELDPELAAVGLLGILHWGASSYEDVSPGPSTAEAARQITRLALHGLVAGREPGLAAVPPVPAGVGASAFGLSPT